MKVLLYSVMILSFCVSATFADNSQIMDSYGKIPLAFTANIGQADPHVSFTTRGVGCSMFFNSTGTTFLLSRETAASVAGRSLQKKAALDGDIKKKMDQDREYESFAVKTSFVGASENPDVNGEGRLSWNNNYFMGNDHSKWRTDIPNYSKLRFSDVYQGIDLVYYGNKNRIKYDFIVKAGEDPSKISVKYDLGDNGGNSISINAKGQLEISTPLGVIIEEKPLCYQMIGGKKIPVDISYNIIDRSDNIFGFKIGEYDTTEDLTIDPELIYSTFLGGSNIDNGYAIAIDSTGNAYITGSVNSTEYPTTAGAFDLSQNGDYDVFISKLNSTGTALVYSTYLGAGNADYASDIALDSSNCAYVVGNTSSMNFPMINGMFDTSINSTMDAFITKLNASGNALVYSSFLGGSANDTAEGVVVDSLGFAYVTGITYSSNYPVISGSYDITFNSGECDAFLTKVNATGTALIFSTYIGGNSYDYAYDLTLDSSGYIYVLCTTYSANFPVTSGSYDTSQNGNYDIAVTKFNTAGSALVYSAFIGGSSYEVGNGIAVDSSGNVYITGQTYSSDYPVTTGAYDTIFNGGDYDAFVTKLSPTGISLIYSTFLGGSVTEVGNGIAVDSSGNAYVTGHTYSSNFPTTSNGYDTSFNGGDYDAFITKINQAGNALSYASFLGGSGVDSGYGLAVDSGENVYIVGSTRSSNYPVTAGVADSVFNGVCDVFVTKLFSGYTTGALTGTITASLTGTALSGAVVTITPGNYTATSSSTGLYTISGIPIGSSYTMTVTATNYTPYTQSSVSVTAITRTVNVVMTLLPPKLVVSTVDTVYSGSSLIVSIQAKDILDYLFGVSYELNWTNGVYVDVDSTSVAAGNFLGTDILFLSNISETNSKVSVGQTRKTGQTGSNGTGTVTQMRFLVNSSIPANSTITFSLTAVVGNKSDGTPISLTAVNKTVYVLSQYMVWPGDTNNDGTVNQADVLPLGFYFSKTGSARTNRTISWSAHPCLPWSPLNTTYADTNGDGTVNLADISAIGTNWGQTRTVSKIAAEKICSSGDIAPVCQIQPPIAADTEFYVDIAVSNVTDLFGLSFVLNFDNKDLIKPISAEHTDLMGSNPLFLNVLGDDNVSVGISNRAGDASVSGNGIPVRIKFKALKDITSEQVITFSLTDVNANTQDGSSFGLDPQLCYLGLTTGVEDIKPAVFAVYQNKPNPFNPSTTIDFSIPEESRVVINVFNLTGQKIASLKDEFMPLGRHSVVWDAKGMPSGVYFYTIKAGKFSQTKKMLLLR